MITIRHTHLEGTVIEGSAKGDGVYEIAHRNSFTYRRSVGIFIMGSRDHLAKRWKIEECAKALRDAGHEVTVEIDDTPRDRETVLADQAERLGERQERIGARADRQQRQVDADRRRSDELVEHLPAGQPVLVGHHSEQAHRNRLEKSINLAIRAAHGQDYANELARRADAVGGTAQYSATPAATRRRIERLEADLRGVQRNLDGYQTRHLDGKGNPVYVFDHKPATGEYREAQLARKTFVEGQLAHDRAALAAAIKSGSYVEWTRDTVHIGDTVSTRSSGGGQTVKKVNKVTVSVATGYSWDDKVKFSEIRRVHCPHATPEAAWPDRAVIDQAAIDAPDFPRDLEWWKGFAPHGWSDVRMDEDGTVRLGAESASQGAALLRWLETAAGGRLATAVRPAGPASG